MNILAWIVFGALAGWIASIIMRTDDEQGPIMNVIVGIAGAFIGGLIMSMLGSTGVTRFNLSSLIVATLGAIVLLAVVKSLSRHT